MVDEQIDKQENEGYLNVLVTVSCFIYFSIAVKKYYGQGNL